MFLLLLCVKEEIERCSICRILFFRDSVIHRAINAAAGKKMVVQRDYLEIFG